MYSYGLFSKIDSHTFARRISINAIHHSMIVRLKNLTALVAVLFFATATAFAQKATIKTNIPYWATTTPNVALELKLAPRWTFDFSIGYNPFTFNNNKKIKHIALQPEARYWLCSSFAGHFVGANVLYSHYNASGIKLPFGIFSELEHHRFQGNLGALGLVYGYSWMLPNKRWNIEAVVGLGAGYTRYDKYACEVCGSKVGKDNKWFFLPTKFAVSIVYNLF